MSVPEQSRVDQDLLQGLVCTKGVSNIIDGDLVTAASAASRASTRGNPRTFQPFRFLSRVKGEPCYPSAPCTWSYYLQFLRKEQAVFDVPRARIAGSASTVLVQTTYE